MKAHALYSKRSQLAPCYQVAVAMVNVKHMLPMASQRSNTQNTFTSQILPISGTIVAVFFRDTGVPLYSVSVDMMHVLNLLFLVETVQIL